MKLSKVQQNVVDLMGSGWELGEIMGMRPWCSLQKGGQCKGGDSIDVCVSTVRVLQTKEAIKEKSRVFPLVRYELIERDD